MSSNAKESQGVAHPYVRISDPQQRKGGGLERQTNADVGEFCRRFGFTPSKRTLIDDGVSAWKGLNASPDHALGKFLEDARRGLIPPGDCLLIENYDRLSRQNAFIAVGLIGELRELRIHVGRLDRMKLLRYDSDDPGDFFDVALEVMRGNSESNLKSFRNSAKWEVRREKAREKKETLTRMLPAWIREDNGKRELVLEYAATIRKIFHLAATGYGKSLIVKKLTEDGDYPFGSGKHWITSYVARLLTDRRVLGELQPRRHAGKAKGRGEPIGDPIPDYFPAAITQEEWDAARAACLQRTHSGTRQGKRLDMFAKLLKNARERDAYSPYTCITDGKYIRRLINHNAVQGLSKAYTFPLATFEAAILSQLEEIDPHDILNGDSGPDESQKLAAEFNRIEVELADARADLRKAFDEQKPTNSLREWVSELDTRRAAAVEKLALARQRAEHPLSETWGEAQSLIKALATADDPTSIRIRLRAALRRIVESIWLYVVPQGRDIYCAAQIWFRKTEDYGTTSLPVTLIGKKSKKSRKEEIIDTERRVKAVCRTVYIQHRKRSARAAEFRDGGWRVFSSIFTADQIIPSDHIAVDPSQYDPIQAFGSAAGIVKLILEMDPQTEAKDIEWHPLPATDPLPKIK